MVKAFIKNLSRSGLAFVLLAIVLCIGTFAQTTKPAQKRVAQIDMAGFRSLIKPQGRPLLINFWATWCDPCREEFPELVKLDAAYKGKVDIITVSLDDVADIDSGVPKFLASMKAEMPAYLLSTPDEPAAIQLVSKDWSGNLPLTVFMDAAGIVVYQRNGKIRFDAVKENIDRVLGAAPTGSGTIETIDFIKIKDGRRDDARYYYENNWRLYRETAARSGLIDSYEYIDVSNVNAKFDIILITRFKGEAQFQNSDSAFAAIIKDKTPNGPYLRGTSKPDDFRDVVFSYTGKAVFSGSK